MPRTDDSDMKIVGRRTGAGAEKADAQRFMDYTSREHFNGNFQKAKALGASIVSAFSYAEPPADVTELILSQRLKPSEELTRQIRFLSVFSAQFAIENYLPSQLLSSVAVCEMYDTLRAYSEPFYEDLAKSNAFSFYNLTLGAVTEDPVLSLGRQFSALCAAPDDPRYVSLGVSVHRLNLKKFKQAINACAFA